MKKFSESAYKETLSEIISKLKKEIINGFATKGSCNIYIATLNNSNQSEVFVNDQSVFHGPESVCNKIFKDILNTLKNTDYTLGGDLKEVVYVRRSAY